MMGSIIGDFPTESVMTLVRSPTRALSHLPYVFLFDQWAVHQDRLGILMYFDWDVLGCERVHKPWLMADYRGITLQFLVSM